MYFEAAAHMGFAGSNATTAPASTTGPMASLASATASKASKVPLFVAGAETPSPAQGFLAAFEQRFGGGLPLVTKVMK